MKIIPLVGSRNKSDFALYLSYIIKNLDKRVLLVDTTTQAIYRHGYTRLEEKQHLFDFQGIDILCGAKNWLDIEQLLRAEDETTSNYDVMFIDMDNEEVIASEWPEMKNRFYVGDDEKYHQLQDVELLHRLFDETENTNIERISFKSNYRLTPEYFDSLLKSRATWRAMNHIIEPDELSDKLRIQMQHEQHIPFSHINKQYKEILIELVSSLFEIHVKEVNDALKPSFFKFGKKKGKGTKQDLAIANSNT